MKAKTSDASQKNVEEMQPYPPSFVDRFMGFIQQLPVPYWLTYMVLFIFHNLFAHVVFWIVGVFPAFTFNSITLTYPLLLWVPLALMTYLDSTALKAVSNFSPLLDLPPGAVQRLKYEFTTMPARGVIISILIWLGIYSLYLYLTYQSYVASEFGTFFIIFASIDGLGPFLIGSTFFYHSIRQLNLVHRTVQLVRRYDLFRLDPFYAFSALTSRAGIAWVFLPGLTLLLSQIERFAVILLFLLGVVVAVVAFTLPLWVVRQRLVAEKGKLLAEHAQRVKSTLTKLHHCVDKNELDDVPQLKSVLDGLNAEESILEKIRTWPWKTETLSGFLSAIALPILLLLLQIAIQEWLNI